jgi:hypothetical protein
MKKLVQSRHTTVETASVVMACQSFFAPQQFLLHARCLRLLAAARKAAVGFGGFSRRSRTLTLSRAVRTIRSCRATIFSATGKAVRMTKLVRSTRSYAAAAARRRFCSREARNSIRSSRVVDRVGMKDLLSLKIAYVRCTGNAYAVQSPIMPVMTYTQIAVYTAYSPAERRASNGDGLGR